MSWVTRAWILGHAVTTSCPGSLRPVSKGLRCRPAVLGDSGRCPRARGVDQLSRATRVRVRVPVGLSRCPGRLQPGTEGPLGRPTVPGDSGPCLRARGIDQLYRATRALVQGPVVSLCAADVLRMGPRSPGVYKRSGATQSRVRSPAVDQLSRVTRGCARCPAWSTSSPGQLGSWSDVPRFRPGVRATPAHSRSPSGLTSCPRQLGRWSEGLRCRPGVPGDSGPCPSARMLEQLSRATRDCT